ncbi:MAG: T9SS type A sorting domain-containing protein [Bacteroidales bacterium]|nr:T9SS type A sorting domain-containing protein [Bacteroidales bacterium]
MKKFLLIITSFILFYSSSHLKAQEIAPIGAEWHYTMRLFMSEEERFVHIESIKDTVVNEKLCRMLDVKHGFSCYFYNEKEFVYQEDSIVYFYSPVVNDFQIMYDLNAKKDSSWVIIYKVDPFITDTVLVTVDSVYSISINNKSLLAFDVTYQSLIDEFWHYTGTIVELMGDKLYLFNYISMASGAICDVDYPGGLRCYQDNYLGFYSTGIAESCTFVTDISEHKSITTINNYPNPFNNSTTLSYKLNSDAEVTITIFNQVGETIEVIKQKSQAGEQKLLLNTETYPAGIYYYSIISGNQQIKNKMIKVN